MLFPKSGSSLRTSVLSVRRCLTRLLLKRPTDSPPSGAEKAEEAAERVKAAMSPERRAAVEICEALEKFPGIVQRERSFSIE